MLIDGVVVVWYCLPVLLSVAADCFVFFIQEVANLLYTSAGS